MNTYFCHFGRGLSISGELCKLTSNGQQQFDILGIKADADGSIFRKNIGRVFLNMASDPYLQVWDIDMSKSENKRNYGHLINEQFENELEMPQICQIMFEKMIPGDEILHTTPSGKSSIIKIRYNLTNR